jgi:hypothetical protein
LRKEFLIKKKGLMIIFGGVQAHFLKKIIYRTLNFFLNFENTKIQLRTKRPEKIKQFNLRKSHNKQKNKKMLPKEVKLSQRDL